MLRKIFNLKIALVLLIIISHIFYIYICRFNVVDLLFLIFIILVKCKIIVIKEV